MDDINKALIKFIKKFNIDDIEGILLYGSVVSGKTDDKSDIDVMIVRSSGYNKQGVGVCYIDDRRIEYFIYGIDYLFEEAQKEIDNNDPSHLTKFITSKIIFDKTGKFSEEVNKIKTLYEIPIKPKHDNHIKKEIFHINNRLEKLTNLKDAESFYISYYDILSKIRDMYILKNGLMYIPLQKTEKLFKDPRYMKEYIMSDIHKGPDNVFMDKYLKALKLGDKDEMINRIEDLFKYSIKDESFNTGEFFLEFDENGRFRI